MSVRVDDPAALVAQVARVAAAHPRCFWLDGGGAREWSGRRSLVGWLDDGDVSLTYRAATREVRRHAGGASTVVGDDVLAVLEAELAAGPTDAQWFGWLGYASRPDLPARPAHADDVPDACWMRPSHLRLVDHPPPPDDVGGPGSPGSPGRAGPAGEGPVPPVPAWYAAAFARVQERLHAGDTYEVNLTHRTRTTSPLDPLAVHARLRALNPAPYAGYLQHDVEGARGWLVSSSPERYARIDADRVLETKPIKGTTPRGATAAEDAAQRRRLVDDERFRAENLMIVDLLRHDLGSVCEPGTVRVPSLMAVESYASVHQLVSSVRGRLRDDVGTVAALRALFPAGSMTGAPKRRTMEVVDAVETTPRGAYAGALGWIAADGRADLGVVIRSLTTPGRDPDGGPGAPWPWTLGTGGGVTVLSDVDAEWAEAHLKATRLLAALDPALDPGSTPG